jgi:hypothetical protein
MGREPAIPQSPLAALVHWSGQSFATIAAARGRGVESTTVGICSGTRRGEEEDARASVDAAGPA